MSNTSKTYLFIFIALCITATSCAPDEDGPTPGQDARDKYIGQWKATETSQLFGASVYNINISKSASSESQIRITNFYQLGNNTNTFSEVNVSGDGNSLTVFQQLVSGQTLIGTGTFSNSKIKFTFTANDGQNVDNVTMDCTKL
jgi:glycosidase